jgi:thiamine-phosphate pyrophosphorylase
VTVRAEQFGELLRSTRVYAVTDDGMTPEQLLTAVGQILKGGIRIVQYRDKLRPDGERVQLARSLVELVHRYGGLLIVNDRVDIAIAADADGAHLGQDDLPLAIGRRLLGPDRLLGASASYLHELAPAEADGIDYLGFGAVFPTGTKPDAEFAGLDLLEQACRQVSVPSVGIGGISAERAPSVLARGVTGVAVVSALFRADDPYLATQELLRAAQRSPSLE